MIKKRSGFTIIELLIVIVVIAILATVTIVAYNGIHQRAKISTVGAELSNFIKSAELMKIDNGHYPTTDAEFKKLLQDTDTWNSTRDGNRKTYLACSTSDDFAIVSISYITGAYNGATLYYGSNSNSVSTFVYDDSVVDSWAGGKICKNIRPSATYRQWAHAIS